MTIRQATAADASRIAEIIVFNNRVNYFPIFRDEGFSFGFVDPDAAIRTNRAMISDNTAEKTMCEREARVLELISKSPV